MPYRRENTPYWYISYRAISGKKVCESSQSKDFREAKALEEARRVEARKYRKWGIEPDRTFEEVIIAYLDAHSDIRSAQRNRYSAISLGRTFAGLAMRQIGGAQIREYVTVREADGVGKATIRRELGLFSAAINWCRREMEWNIRNPVQGRRPKAPPGRVRWISRDEAALLIQAADRNSRAPLAGEFIRLALHTGMRRGELLGLEWRRVDLAQGMVYLGTQHQKNGRYGSVPLNGEARRVLVRLANWRAEHCPATRWVFCHRDGSRLQSVKRSFLTACQQVGIEDFTPHDLRHTFAAWLVQSGVQILDVRDLLRHTDIGMTQKYAHLAPENLRAAVERLDRAEGFNLATVEPIQQQENDGK